MNRTNFEIEICANSVESCIEAQKGGANRVELCMGIPEGGTTPSYGEIKMAREVLTDTRLHVIIRNRGGDFFYTEQELQRMAIDIDLCRELGVDGVVFGCLTAEGDIDLAANEYLMSHAKGMSMTFHRAFDRCREPEKALEQRLNQLANGRIKIMAGCGVNEKNIARIRQETAVPAFHFSAREPQTSRMTYSNPSVYMGAEGTDEDTIMLTTERRVRNTIDALMREMV